MVASHRSCADSPPPPPHMFSIHVKLCLYSRFSCLGLATTDPYNSALESPSFFLVDEFLLWVGPTINPNSIGLRAFRQPATNLAECRLGSDCWSCTSQTVVRISNRRDHPPQGSSWGLQPSTPPRVGLVGRAKQAGTQFGEGRPTQGSASPYGLAL